VGREIGSPLDVMAATQGSECAICYEPLESESQKAALPCDCKAEYCLRCYCQALAQSFHACGWPRCPSCRVTVSVDFDSEALLGVGRLLFSREAPVDLTDSAACEEARQQRQRETLLEQARPAQRRLLQQYGRERGAHLQSAALLARADADALSSPGGHAQSREEAGKRIAEAICAFEVAPRCVCGDVFRRVSLRERAGRICQRSVPRCPPPGTQEFERVVDFILTTYGPPSSCDLCGEQMDDFVWTCESGHDTILHTNAYDVCDTCLVRHTYRSNVVGYELCASAAAGAAASSDATTTATSAAPIFVVAAANRRESGAAAPAPTVSSSESGSGGGYRLRRQAKGPRA